MKFKDDEQRKAVMAKLRGRRTSNIRLNAYDGYEYRNLKPTTNNTLLFGDIDKDGVRNIDDPRPFNKTISTPPEHKSYYTKARFSGHDIKLSDELKALERHGNKYSPLLKKFLEENRNSYGRIKTVPSTMKKLRTRHIQNVGDIAGVTVEVDNYKQVKEKVAQIKKRYKTILNKEDNFYKKPKGGVYYAHHLTITDKKGNEMEVQIKTHKQAKLHARMHHIYKKGMTEEEVKELRKEALELARKDKS